MALLNTYTITGTINGLLSGNTYPVIVTATATNGYSNLSATTTNSSYVINNVPYGWTGSLAATSPAYTLVVHPNLTFTSPVTTNQGQNFLATLNTYTISGTITGLVPGNIYPVTITAAGTGSNPTFTTNASNGNYTINNVPYGWSGNLTASSAAYSFTPLSIEIPSIAASLTGKDFAATLKTYTVSGTFLDNNNNPLPSWASAKINGQSVDPVSGAYSFTVNYGDSITLTSVATGYNITPSSPVVLSNITENKTQNFVGTIMKFSISGNISDLSIPDNITITATGIGSYTGQNFPATVQANGTYSTAETIPYNWTGNLVTASSAYNLLAITPVYNGQAITGDISQDYTATLKTFTISGNISGILPSNPYPITVSASTTNNPTYGGVYQSYPNINATSGTYSLTVPYGWTGTIIASGAAYDFIPASISIPAVTVSLTSQNFAATLKTYTVSGDILNIIPGANYPITITANCSNILAPWYSSPTNIDASSGHYGFTIPYGWKGSLLISSPAYELKESPSVTFSSPVTSNQVQNYRVVKLKEFNITGTVTFDSNYNTTFPITIKASCSNPLVPWYKNITTNVTAGHYAMKLPYGWEGALVPTSQAYILTEDPAVTFNSPVFTDQVQNYLAKIKMFTISGHTYLDGLANKPIAGVSLQAKGTGAWVGYSTSATSNIEGDYTFDVPYSWKGTVKPSKANYTFMPTNRSYNNVTANYTAQDYLGTLVSPTPAATYTISGYVKTTAGAAIQGVAILDNLNKIVATTNNQGYYSFNKAAGWSGTAKAVKSPYKFSPPNYSYANLSANQDNKNYVRQ
jgi:hypothetical protein